MALVALAGCNDDDKSRPPVVDAAPPPAPKVPAGPPRPQDVAVIRAWVAKMRAGRPDQAARYFSLPVLVANFTPDEALVTPRAVRHFNESLPCGARLVEARRSGDYTIGVFVLTDRPGGDCGSGTGHRAATAFRFRNGRISEWRRVDVPRFAPPAPPPNV